MELIAQATKISENFVGKCLNRYSQSRNGFVSECSFDKQDFWEQLIISDVSVFSEQEDIETAKDILS